MFLRATLLAAAAAVGLSAAPANAASYTATSQYHNGKAKHSIGFSRYKNGNLNILDGAEGKKKRWFLFENSTDGAGKFDVNGNTATLSGIIRNSAGQGFRVSVTFERTKNPGVYANKRGASQTDWAFYKMTSGSLTSLTEGLKSFDLSMRGKKWNGKTRKLLAGQFGTGANNKNVDMLGFFSKFKATEQGCEGGMDVCEKYNLNMKLIMALDPDDGPSASKADDDGAAVVPLPAAGLMLPAALGLMGVAGIRRRRRQA